MSMPTAINRNIDILEGDLSMFLLAQLFFDKSPGAQNTEKEEEE